MVMLVFSILETLKSIDKRLKRLVELAEQKKQFYILIALNVIAIIISAVKR